MTTANPTLSNRLSSNKPVLVLAPTPYFSDRGAHIRIYEEAKQLQALGYEPLILTYPLGRDITNIPTVRVRGLKSYTKSTAGFSWHKLYLDVLLWRKAVRLIKQQRPLLVHAHLHESAWIGWLLKLQFKLPFVLDVQGMAPAEFPIPAYEAWAVKRANVVCVSSAATHKALQAKYSKLTPKFVLLEDGIGLTLEATIKPPQQYDVVYSGGLGDKKGTDLLAEAMKLVKAQRPTTSILMITPKQPLPYEQLLPALAKARVGVDPKPSTSSEGSAKALNYLAAGLIAVAMRDYQLPNTVIATEATAQGLANAILKALAETPKPVDVFPYSWDQRRPIIEQTYAQLI